MDAYFIIFISMILLILISGIILIVRGRKIMATKFKYIPLILIFIDCFAVVILTLFTEKRLKKEIERVEIIQDQLLFDKQDSVLFTAQKKKQLLDSLKKTEVELDEILARIRKQEKIIGSKTAVLDNVENTRQKTTQMIDEIANYNEVVENATYNNCCKGYTSSGETSLFTFFPPLNTNDDYLDFSIRFNNEELINKIAVIYIEVVKRHNDGNMTHIYGQYYKPQSGINTFRLKNYFRKKDVQMTIGFFWKSDFCKSDYPRYEKITYSLESI